MKRNTELLTLITVVAFCYNVVSQEIPKKADKIEVISSEISNHKLFREAVLQLKEDGYTWSDIDKDFYIVKTDPVNKNGSMKDYYIVIHLSVSKNTVAINGELRDKETERYGESWYDVRNLSGGVTRWSWNLMDEYAVKLQNRLSGQIKYLRTN